MNKFTLLIFVLLLSHLADSHAQEVEEKRYPVQHYKIETTKNGKEQLIDPSDGSIKIIAHQVRFMGANITAYDTLSQQYILYDAWANKLPLNVRTIDLLNNSGRPLLLIDNELKYLIDGELHDTAPNLHSPTITCGMVAHYSNKIVHQKNGKIRLHHTIDLRMLNGKNKRSTYQLHNTQQVDSLCFMYGNDFHSYLDFGEWYSYSDIMFGKKKNGKYNIYQFAMDDKKKQFTLTPQLTEDCDSISMKIPIRFYNNNLVGEFPTMTTAKYKSINTQNGNFLRFETSDNRKGWMYMRNGKEYLDI